MPSWGSLEALVGLQKGPTRAPRVSQDVPKSGKKRDAAASRFLSISGPSWSLLGPLGESLGSSCGPLRRTPRNIIPRAFGMILRGGCFGSPLGVVLGPSWSLLGPPLGRSWDLLGPPRESPPQHRTKSLWYDTAGGCFGGPLGVIWGPFGTFLGPSRSPETSLKGAQDGPKRPPEGSIKGLRNPPGQRGRPTTPQQVFYAFG